MNIKFASLSLIITAAAGLSFVQSANASDEDGQPQRPGSRFNYAGNLFRLETPTGGGRHAPLLPYAPTPSGPVGNVKPGAVPKMALDPTFLAPPKPVPTIAPIVKATIVPVALKPQSFTSIPKASPFQSIFGNPQPLVAKMEKPLAPGQQPQQIAQTTPPAAPASRAARTTTGVHGVLSNHRPTGMHASAPASLPVASYGQQYYTPGATLPQQTASTGASVDTSVRGVITRKH